MPEKYIKTTPIRHYGRLRKACLEALVTYPFQCAGAIR